MLINNHFSETGSVDNTIGTGTTNKPEYPIYFFYDYGYFAFIYKNSEMGVGGPVNITGIRYQMRESASTESANNQTLKLGQVNQTQFDINIRNNMTQVPLQPVPWIANNITIVKSNFTWTVINNPPTWTEIQFDTPFTYDPTDSTYPHLLIVWENGDGSYSSGAISPWSECFTDGTPRSYYDYADNSMPLSTDYGTRDSTGTPNIQLIYAD
jgi:hypothetical protein